MSREVPHDGLIKEIKDPSTLVWVDLVDPTPADLRDLNYGKFVEHGEIRITASDDYTSHNTEQLDVDGMKAMLLKLPFVRDLVAGKPARPED